MSDQSMDFVSAWWESQVPAIVGRATIAWNNVSLAVFELFHILSEIERETAKATFFVVSSDRSQRDMVSALIDLRLKTLDEKLAKKAQSQIGEINRLAGKRNDILHVIYLDDTKPNEVKQFHDRGHLKGKSGNELLDSIHSTTMECLDLSNAILKTCAETLSLPHYQIKELAALFRRHMPPLKSGELANQEVFGLLNFPATTPHSPEETQE